MPGRKKKVDKESVRKLRVEAENKTRKEEALNQPEGTQALRPAGVEELLHELRVHQIELEMQNDELRMAHEKLEELQARYFELYDMAPVGYFRIDEKGMILEANLTGAKLLAVMPQDLRTIPFSNFVLKEDRDIYYLHRRQLFETGAPQLCEMRMLSNGSPFWARVEAVLAQGGKGRKRVCHAAISNITAQKQAAGALQESEEKYRLVVENAQEAIYIAVDGILKFGNTKAAELSGYSQEDLESTPFIEFIHKDDRDMVVGRYLRRLKGEVVPDKYAFRIIDKPGNIRWVELTVVLINWEGKQASLNFLTDISDRRRLEEEQQRVAKLESVGLLAGGIAHDFNNILTAILGNISLAKMEAPPGSEIGESLAQAEKASLRAKGLTKQLLTFSKGGAPVKRVVSVTELIRDTAGFALRGSNVKYHFSPPDGLWPAEVDEGQVSQAIHNLVINAQQAMPTGGTIELLAENIALSEIQSIGRALPLKAGDYIRITVTDHGTGIPAEHLEKIFDPFFTTKQKGSGLGLATSFSIVRQHGGHISVESEVGAGSTFYLYLPASGETAAPKQENNEAVKSVGKARILVMDDEQGVREVVGRMLKHLGYKDVAFAADGATAIKLYKAAMESANPFTVCILDLTIPGGMGGEMAVTKLLKIDPAVKAIVSSGYVDDAVVAKYRDYGFSGVVAKPYTIAELRKALQEVIG